jgi:hypothetical protein
MKAAESKNKIIYIYISVILSFIIHG